MKTAWLLLATSTVLCGGAAPLPVARAPFEMSGERRQPVRMVVSGRKRGQTLEMDLPAGVTFVDLMGNERKAKVKGEGERRNCPVPLTPAPLFVVGRKDQAEALLTAVKTALTDDPSQAIAAEIRPEADGSVVLEVENTTSRTQVAGLGGGRGLELAANGRKAEKLAEVSVEPMKTYAFTTNYPFLAGPWKMNWFFVPKCGERPDWTSLPSLPIANEVRRSAAKPGRGRRSASSSMTAIRAPTRARTDFPSRRSAARSATGIRTSGPSSF